MDDNLDQIIQRTQRYWYQDGLPEIATGLLLLVGGFLVSLAAAPHGEPDSMLALIVALLILVLATVATSAVGLGVQGTLEALKNRVTYPRTGYVSYRKPQPRIRTPLARIGYFLALIILSGVLGAVMGYVASLIMAAGVSAWLFSMSMVTGVWFAVLLSLMGHRYSLPRFYVLALVSLILGVLTALGDMTFVGSVVYFAVMGGVLVTSGAIVLALYLRHHATPAEDYHDR